ncbi:MAG: alpha/beta hydrolase [Flavobacteriales bacterium]|nr:alpha/beta hydrolase [Flavobacteriales bacterium]
MKKSINLIFFLLYQFLFSQDKNYSEWYLQREDVQIFVKEIGTGKDTLIVLHGGFGANHDYMIDAVKGLEEKYRIFLYDQRGSLLSPTKKENLTFQKNVADLKALISALKLKKAKLFCHSMGTLVGMEFTKQYPQLVSHLILSGTILPKSDSLKSIFSERYESQIDFLINRKDVVELIKPFKDKGLEYLKTIEDIDNSVLSHKDLTNYWRINFAAPNLFNVKKYNQLKGGRAYYNESCSIMTETVNWKFDYREVLNSKVKTTIINGEYDFFDFDGTVISKQIQDFKNIELKIIENAGHNCWIDQQNTFKRLLLNALKRK